MQYGQHCTNYDENPTLGLLHSMLSRRLLRAVMRMRICASIHWICFLVVAIRWKGRVALLSGNLTELPFFPFPRRFVLQQCCLLLFRFHEGLIVGNFLLGGRNRAPSSKPSFPFRGHFGSEVFFNARLKPSPRSPFPSARICWDFKILVAEMITSNLFARQPFRGDGRQEIFPDPNYDSPAFPCHDDALGSRLVFQATCIRDVNQRNEFIRSRVHTRGKTKVDGVQGITGTGCMLAYPGVFASNSCTKQKLQKKKCHIISGVVRSAQLRENGG